MSAPDALLPLLKSTFGFDHFRGRQADVVARVMAAEHTLAVMPTGAGKSLTYQLPAVALDGCVVVVSPLIALMHAQLRGARAVGGGGGGGGGAGEGGGGGWGGWWRAGTGGGGGRGGRGRRGPSGGARARGMGGSASCRR